MSVNQCRIDALLPPLCSCACSLRHSPLAWFAAG
jgi:hypothetical protein